MSVDTQVLIVVFDALRPEFVTPDLMPNYHAFATRGVRYTNYHSTFPTETRVNQSAVVTGCYPSRHGVVANKFIEPAGAPNDVLNTGDDVLFEAAIERLDGKLLDVPSLGEYLARSNLRYATISAGTPGGGRLINIKAEETGSFRFAMRRQEATVPAGALEALQAKIGLLPDYVRPAIDWISYAVDGYLKYVEPEISPHVMVLWLCEPDESFHYLGLGSPGSLDAIRHVDAEFGRILKARADDIESGRLQIVALSDHGQITLEGEPLDLAARLTEAGFPTATKPNGDATSVVVVDNAGGLWLPRSDPALIEQLVDWLRAQEWCGPIFTRNGIAGTLRQVEIGLDHRRAPDISLCLKAGDGDNAWGINGRTTHDAPYPIGGGCHGGLSACELHNVLAVGGSKFAQGRVVDLPAGNADITPTVLSLLGLEIPSSLDGRVLSESFDGSDQSATIPDEQILTSQNDEGAVTHLSVTTYAGTRYLNRAWVE